MTQEQPIRFSYSGTNTYKTCPTMFQKINYLKTFKSETHPAALRGSIMHEELEQAINEDTMWDPEYDWILEDFRSDTGLKMAEMKLAIDNHWRPTPYNLGYDEEGKEIKNPEVFYCGIIDMTVLNGSHAIVRDLKTGKRRFEEAKDYDRWMLDNHDKGMQYAPKILSNARQANDYALLTMHHFPSIKTMDFAFVWSDVEGVKYDWFHFDRSKDDENMHKTMLAIPRKIQKSVMSDEWEPNPSGLCRLHCPVVSCKYNGKSMGQITKMRKMK